MPLGLISKYPRAGLILANSIGAVVMNAVTFNIPLYFQAVLLESATDSGLRLIAPILAASMVGTATGFLITWTKRLKWLLVLGVFFMLAGTIILLFMQRGMPGWAYVLFLLPYNIGQGFMFPTTFMSVLAVSEQAEQAVVTSTLILWRSMGMVLGVALSSLVLQNALYYYLEQNVIGPDKSKVRVPTTELISLMLTCSGYRRSSQISTGNSEPPATLSRASYRVIRIILETHLRFSSGPLSSCGLSYYAPKTTKIGSEKIDDIRCLSSGQEFDFLKQKPLGGFNEV
jgi:hypothetical protein